MKYIDVISNSLLFSGIPKAKLIEMLECLEVKIIDVKKGSIIIDTGDEVSEVGLVLNGEISIIKEDIDGDSSLMANLHPSEHFAEVFCCAEVNKSPVCVVASKDSTILLVEYDRVINKCNKDCTHHNVLITNMLSLVANKTLAMQIRNECLSQKSIKKKILKYLQIASKNRKSFEINFDRAELADYLCVDRSALSRELSKLKDEGYIDYWKNHFKINY